MTMELPCPFNDFLLRVFGVLSPGVKDDYYQSTEFVCVSILQILTLSVLSFLAFLTQYMMKTDRFQLLSIM